MILFIKLIRIQYCKKYLAKHGLSFKVCNLNYEGVLRQVPKRVLMTYSE